MMQLISLLRMLFLLFMAIGSWEARIEKNYDGVPFDATRNPMYKNCSPLEWMA